MLNEIIKVAKEKNAYQVRAYYYLFTLHSSLFTFHFSLTYGIFGKVIK